MQHCMQHWPVELVLRNQTLLSSCFPIAYCLQWYGDGYSSEQFISAWDNILNTCKYKVCAYVCIDMIPGGQGLRFLCAVASSNSFVWHRRETCLPSTLRTSHTV